MPLPGSLAARLRAFAPDDKELGMLLEDLALAVRSGSGSGYDLRDSEAFAAGLPLELRRAPQAHMQALVHDFRRRQRQASVLVAGCIATFFALTAIGIAALASFDNSTTRAHATPTTKKANSVVWHKSQDAALPKLIIAGAAPVSPVPDSTPTPRSAPGTTPQSIVLHPGQTVEFAPLISHREARYVLIRGLPNAITLSVGQRNPSGAWLVKDKDLDRLTLSIGSGPSGDYPVEVYALGASSAPQARQRLMFRVEASAGPTTASVTNTSGTMFNTALGAAPQQTAAATQPPRLMARAMRLLDEGDIAGARLLLINLAEQGESDATYQLARTFDAESLTEIGAQGVGPDKTRAVGWYERASETGSVKAAERLKTLASLSD
jgi:hypothetical protein